MKLTRPIFFALYAIMMVACGYNTENKPSYSSTHIKSLKTTSEQSAFVQDLFESSEKLQNETALLKSKYGDDSTILKDHFDKKKKLDKVILDKIDSYLKIHDHPDKKNHGDINSHPSINDNNEFYYPKRRTEKKL